MATGEQPTSQRKLRETARTKLAQIEACRAVSQWTNEGTLRDALKAVAAASVRARSKTIREFAGRLAQEAIVIGDLDTDPEAVKLWRPLAGSSSMRRDGQIIDSSGEYKVLGVVSYSDTCCVTAEQATQADETWREGDVLLIDTEEPINCPALLLPRHDVPVQWIGKALSRHFETTVSQPELVA